jgi:hypothetical protein
VIVLVPVNHPGGYSERLGTVNVGTWRVADEENLAYRTSELLE